MDTILQVTTSYELLPIVELIGGFKEKRKTLKQESLEFEFYNRFAPYVYKVAVENTRNENDPEDAAKDILQLTFIKAFEKIKGYEFPDLANTEQYKTNCIKAWLGKIAARVFLKAIAKQQNKHVDIDSLNLPWVADYVTENTEEEPVITNENHLKLQEALKLLSVDERLIVLTYANEGCVHSTKHLSAPSMEFLCQTLSTNSVTIRKRKQRILEKINSILFPS